MTLNELINDYQDRIIFETVAGSFAYGTGTQESDSDVRGIFVLPNSAYAALKAPPDQIADYQGDTVYYSLRRFLQLAGTANPNIIELLYMPNDCIRRVTPVMERLLADREVFISKACFTTHIGYAKAQIKKARGRNKWINNPQPEEPPPKENFCWIIGLQKRDRGCIVDSEFPCRPVPLTSADVDLSECHCAALEHCPSVYRLYHYGKRAMGCFRGNMLVCRSIPTQDEWQRFRGLLIFNETAWMRAKKDHQNYWEWRRNRNKARWRQL